MKKVKRSCSALRRKICSKLMHNAEQKPAVMHLGLKLTQGVSRWEIVGPKQSLRKTLGFLHTLVRVVVLESSETPQGEQALVLKPLQGLPATGFVAVDIDHIGPLYIAAVRE